MDIEDMTEVTGLLGISNAIVDVLAHVDEDFPDRRRPGP
jgi:hypothetical protein